MRTKPIIKKSIFRSNPWLVLYPNRAPLDGSYALSFGFHSWQEALKASQHNIMIQRLGIGRDEVNSLMLINPIG